MMLFRGGRLTNKAQPLCLLLDHEIVESMRYRAELDQGLFFLCCRDVEGHRRMRYQAKRYQEKKSRWKWMDEVERQKAEIPMQCGPVP